MKQHQASSTAFTVLQGILYTSQNPAYADLVSDDMKDGCLNILSASEEGRKRLQQLESWWFKSRVPIVERLMIPGITLHYVLRKRYIEDYTLQTIREGTTQVINLGAGFDTLAYRLAQQYPSVQFIEVDHPATHQLKAQALTTPENSRKNLHFLPIDFTTQRLEDVLEQSSYFKSDRATLCILEGVLMYLNEVQIRCLFKSLKQMIYSGVRVIFTSAEPASKSPYSYGMLLKLYLKIKGEPFNWICEKEYLSDFLHSMDYTLQQLADSQTLKQRYLDNYTGILHEGEYIAVAESLSKL